MQALGFKVHRTCKRFTSGVLGGLLSGVWGSFGRSSIEALVQGGDTTRRLQP